MRYITGTDSTQSVLSPKNLDEIIEANNEVRLLDLFVESLDLSTFSFHLKGSEEKRAFGNMELSFEPMFDTECMLKISFSPPTL
ncbi:MAG TPA: hypothetical protein VEX65_13705 [Flavisolibacter sp.]|jgi:transposase|nr:hypothetical protein [Flavisolibacter sp.]